MTTRTLERVIPSIPASDGAGVKLRRSLGQSQFARLDPFLMLDEFFSDDPNDYLAGFPSHPHRGFETVTYMLDGHMQHQDHLGNRGDLKPGDVQWMTAASGIIHSEMPQQTQGRMRGFQLWINLPAVEKMKPASYRDISSAEIPVVALSNGGKVKVIAGEFQTAAATVRRRSTDPQYFDVTLPAGETFTHTLPENYHAFVYPYEGDVEIGAAPNARKLAARSAGVLSSGKQIEIRVGENEVRFLLLAAKPIGEPIVQYGPFVMNTRDEIEQAIHDYQSGNFGRPAA